MRHRVIIRNSCPSTLQHLPFTSFWNWNVSWTIVIFYKDHGNIHCEFCSLFSVLDTFFTFVVFCKNHINKLLATWMQFLFYQWLYSSEELTIDQSKSPYVLPKNCPCFVEISLLPLLFATKSLFSRKANFTLTQDDYSPAAFPKLFEVSKFANVPGSRHISLSKSRSKLKSKCNLQISLWRIKIFLLVALLLRLVKREDIAWKDLEMFLTIFFSSV